jgi:hypothetical protein
LRREIILEDMMLSNTSRWLTYLTATLYAVLGILLFFLPEQFAPVFAWKVTPFMTMTIGGWCLGNAWLAWIAARRWEWRRIYSALLFLWLFGIFESYVLFSFRDKIQLAHPIAWLYLMTLGVNLLTAVLGIVEWFRLRPARQSFGEPVVGWQRLAVIVFVLAVGYLGLYGVFAQIGWASTQGEIFPEVMSLFTLRSFAFFYLSLALAVVPLVWEPNMSTLLSHAFAAYGFIVAITLAAFVYIRLFDFAAQPGGLLYFGAYLVVGLPLLVVFAMYRKHL